MKDIDTDVSDVAVGEANKNDVYFRSSPVSSSGGGGDATVPLSALGPGWDEAKSVSDSPPLNGNRRPSWVKEYQTTIL
jgi:hypothetical protein